MALPLLVPGDVSAATESCNPNSTDAARFCVYEELVATSNPPGPVAAAPVSLTFSAENTSPMTDKPHWLHSATLTISDASVASPPTLTRSALLPNGLLIAGGGACTAPTYEDCSGGHGSLIAVAHSACCPEISVPATGSFGIAKVVNMNPPGTGNYARFQLSIKASVCVLGTCYPAADTTQDITVPEPGGGSAPISFTILTDGSSSIPLPEEGGTAEYALDSFSFHLNGESSQLDSGPAGSTYTILAAPRDCVNLSATSAFSSQQPLAVELPQSLSITGCPIAAFAPPGLAGPAVILDGSPSHSSIAGRSIASWHWDFGDGSSAVTHGPTATHEYAPGSRHTASLFVEDSAGARSGSETQDVSVPAASGLGTSGAPGPPDTKITKSRIKSAGKQASFTFQGSGSATGFECMLKKRKKRGGSARFRECRSPKRYRGLTEGTYVFKVRAKGPGGTNPTPAKRKFEISG